MPDTFLEVARRHASEGRARIVRQESLVEVLMSKEHDNLVPLALLYLATLRTVQAELEAHVAAEEGGISGPSL
jgi:hypothetical protein